ncbi:hypothetical protein [Streptomyces katrae]|uniref:hypothetical protein n=1 Tax=Streptomyces katrae TaxID=68223 RepID=UPI000695C4FC|nr:hypothetical protein [Streptomyces katrae]
MRKFAHHAILPTWPHASGRNSKTATATPPLGNRQVERQTATLRTLTCRAFPEPNVSDDASAPSEQARAQRRRQAGATEATAWRRVRAEKSGHQMQPRRLEWTA